MPPADPTRTLGQLLDELGPRLTLLAGAADDLAREVDRVVVWMPGQPVPAEKGTLLVCPVVASFAGLVELAGGHGPRRRVVPRMVVIWPHEQAERTLAEGAGHVVVVAAADADLAELISDIVRSAGRQDSAAARRLAALQRSLTQALGEADPVPALAGRLSKVCNAAVALIDLHGGQQHATGPLPLALLHQEIRRVDVETQTFDVQGWRGVAVRVANPVVEGAAYGWTVAAARRPGFPDPYAMSAVQVASALVETSLRIELVTRRQDRAVRSALLEQAVSLTVQRDDRELSGRIAGLGVSFDQELRAVAVRQQRPTRGGGAQALETLADSLVELFTRADVAHLVTVRDKGVAVLVQASADAVRTLLLACPARSLPLHVGIGRAVASVGDVADSYHDALLAIQAQRHRPSDTWIVAYEDFDFATRLFAEVGLDRMAAWADGFLAPLEGRKALLEGLITFFEHDQNINAAAEAIDIHHNSLRYRLAKVEELLDVTLRDPAAVSSVFLALTAQKMARPHLDLALGPRGRRAVGAAIGADVDAPSSATRAPNAPSERGVGVAVGPDR
jgi:sugar diacid utilization regulator